MQINTTAMQINTTTMPHSPDYIRGQQDLKSAILSALTQLEQDNLTVFAYSTVRDILNQVPSVVVPQPQPTTKTPNQP